MLNEYLYHSEQNYTPEKVEEPIKEFQLKTVSRASKIRIYKTIIIRPVVTYGSHNVAANIITIDGDEKYTYQL